MRWVLRLPGHIADPFFDAATALLHLIANEFIYQPVRFYLASSRTMLFVCVYFLFVLFALCHFLNSRLTGCQSC